MNGMWRRGVALALVLMSGCAATDEPYTPTNPTTTAETDGPIVAVPGPTNPEVFSAIERAESLLGGQAVAFNTRINSYVVTVIADNELHEVTIVSSGIIVNTIRDVDEGVEEFLDSQVVTLADAVDAAAVAHPGRVDSAVIVLEGDRAVYEVIIEVDEELVTAAIDAYSAEVLQP